VSEANYDVIIIGAGPGGYVAAVRCSQLGLKAAIVERDTRLGGTCLLRGCIPTKALLECAHVYDKARESAKYGVITTGVSLDFAAVQGYREKTVATNSKGVQFLMRKNKVEVLSGHGRLAGKGKVSVTAADGTVTTVAAKHVILATGSKCKDFPGITIDHKQIVNSDDILEIKTVPKSLVILGAGAVGSEFASVYASFGAKVTLVEYADVILPIEDEEVSKELEKIYKKRGIDVRTATSISKAEVAGDVVKITLTPKAGGESVVIEAEMLLVAAGRAAVTGDMGAEGTGVKVDERGFVDVNEFCQTGEPGVYAIGDIIKTPWLAHVASHEAVLVAEHIAGKHPHPIRYDRVPNCTYSDPEVASVGLTEKAARAKGYDVKVGMFPFAANGKARIMGSEGGFIKIVADKKHDELLGVHIVGPKATELISEAVLALELESTVEELFHAMHPHPTLAEAMGEAAAAAFLGAPLNA